MNANPWNLPDETGPERQAGAPTGHPAWPEAGDTAAYPAEPYANGYPADPYGSGEYPRPGYDDAGYAGAGYDGSGFERAGYGDGPVGGFQQRGQADDGRGGGYDRFGDQPEQPAFERPAFEQHGAERYEPERDDRDAAGSYPPDAGRYAGQYQAQAGAPRDAGGQPAPGPSKPAKSGRAGRNLPAAIGVGLGLGAVLVAALLLLKVVFVGIAVVAVLLGLRELAGALRAGDIRMPLIPIAAGAIGMMVAAYTGGPQALVVALALTAFVTLVWRMAEGAERFLRDATAGVFAAVYVPFLASFAVLMVATHDGPKRALLFLILTVCSDTGGYIAGVIGGRHPMAPRISPKKSWEGLAGSIVFAGAGGAIGIHYLLSGNPVEGVVVGLAAVASATLGDLIESVIKRDLGIKDMGNLLPGHGGVMDRLDSLLATAPVVWLLLTVFVPVH